MIYLPLGRREVGKTTLAMHMARRKIDCRMIFDPRAMIDGTAGSVVTSNGRELLDGMTQLVEGSRNELIFTPDDEVNEGFEMFAWYVRDWIKRRRSRRLGIVVDEAAFVMSASEAPTFQWVLRCCARQKQHIFMTAHRPADISTRVRAIADHWLLFACRQEHDLRVIQERCSVDVVDLVQQLDARQFVHWNDAKGTYRTFTDPSTWFESLGRGRQPAPPSPGDTI